MEPRDEVLGEIRRVLRPGGRLVFSEFYTTEPLAWASPELARLACVHDAPNPDDMLRSLRAAGFAEASLEDHSDALHEIEDRVQRRVDVVGLLGTLASGHGDPLWSEASRFLGEARRRRDDGRLRYGIFRAVRG